MSYSDETRNQEIENERENYYFSYDFGPRAIYRRECEENEEMFEAVFNMFPYEEYTITEHPSKYGVMIVSFNYKNITRDFELTEQYVNSFIDSNDIDYRYENNHLAS